jgi:hypothetical protein
MNENFSTEIERESESTFSSRKRDKNMRENERDAADDDDDDDDDDDYFSFFLPFFNGLNDTNRFCFVWTREK